MANDRDSELMTMRKIRLSDADLEMFDIEIAPTEYLFYQKHKDAFRTMWREQGKPFWMRFVITFRSFTVKHGVIKQMKIDSMKFENLVDQAFIFIHEQFVDGRENMAKNFIEDVARLAQNQDKFPALDSKSFSRDPFYLRETRDLFRRFFGMPDQKSSYLKVYILSPIYMRFGGAVCRCLVKWLDAPPHADPNDTSYWVAPMAELPEKKFTHEHMCATCLDDCGTKFFNEKIWGRQAGPKFLPFWTLGDPRFNDMGNPLFSPHCDRDSDWRDTLNVENFREFLHYSKFKYGTDDDKCKECLSLNTNCSKQSHLSRSEKKRRKKKLKEVHAKEVHAKGVERSKISIRDEALALAAQVSTKDLTRLLEFELNRGKKTPALEQIMVDNPHLVSMLEDMPGLNPDLLHPASNGPAPLAPEKPGTVQRRNDIFSKNAKVTDDYRRGMLTGGAGNTDTVGGFKVVKINDDKTGKYEVNITVTASEGDDVTASTRTRLRDKIIRYPLSRDILMTKIEELPQKFEWWEGLGWCAAILDYTTEELPFTNTPTNFTIKISNSDEDMFKKTMIQLLYYVCKRKTRPSLGWCLDVDDVVACIMPDESPRQRGLNICIMRGFRFEKRLTDLEKESMQNTVSLRILMQMEEGMAAQILREKNGEMKLRKLLRGVQEIEKYQNAAKIPAIGIDPKAPNGKVSNLWEKMIANPPKFEMFVMVEPEKEDDMVRQGLVRVNRDTFMKQNNVPMFVCQQCGKGDDCECLKPKGVIFVDKLAEQWEEDQLAGQQTHDEPHPAATHTVTATAGGQLKVKAISLPPPAIRPKDKEGKATAKDKETVVVKNDQGKATPNDKEPCVVKNGQGKATLKVKEACAVKNDQGKATPKDNTPDIKNSKVKATPNDNGLDMVPNGRGQMRQRILDPEVEMVLRKLETATGGRSYVPGKVERKGPPPGQDKASSGDPPDPPKAPVPGMTGSFNFTINNRKQERKISVQMGAYLGDEHVSELEQRKHELETLEEFTDRVQTETAAATAPTSIGQYASEKLFEAVAASLPSDIQDMMTFDLNQNKPASEGMNKVMVVNRADGNKTIIQYRQGKRPPIGENEDMMARLAKVAEEVTNLSMEEEKRAEERQGTGSGIQGGKGGGGEEEKGGEDHQGTGSVIPAGKGRGGGEEEEKGAEDTAGPQKLLKLCGNCQKEEPARRAFKKCQKCKDEGVLDVRYYCGRECQCEDWTKRHRNEHRDGLLL